MNFVSVVVPVYNAELMIGACIEALLAQDYPKEHYEIIIVDNGSSDQTAQIIKQYPVKYLLENTAQSSYAARNKGAQEAKGETLAFTDADCVADPNWLKNGIKAFADEKVGCVAGEIQAAHPESDIEKYLAEKNELSQIKTSPDFPLPYPKTANAFYRKDVFDIIGFFEQKWISGGDADFAWRMQLETSYKLVFDSKALVRHKHRATIRQMFNQCCKWGGGYSLLVKKYKSQIKSRTVKQKIWIIKKIFITSIRLALLSPFISRLSWESKKKYYDDISFVGWELGKCWVWIGL